MPLIPPAPLGDPVTYCRRSGLRVLAWLVSWAPTHAVVLTAGCRRHVGLSSVQVASLRPCGAPLPVCPVPVVGAA